MDTANDSHNSQREVTELAYRAGGGIEVLLLWVRSDDRLEVVVRQHRGERAFVLVAEDGRQALDAFYHPFAYAAARGLASEGAARRDETVARAAPGSSPRRI